MEHFSSWTEQDQIEFVEELLKSMQHHQHGTVNAFLKPMLQRDFISLLPKKVKSYFVSALADLFMQFAFLFKQFSFNWPALPFYDIFSVGNRK